MDLSKMTIDELELTHNTLKKRSSRLAYVSSIGLWVNENNIIKELIRRLRLVDNYQKLVNQDTGTRVRNRLKD